MSHRLIVACAAALFACGGGGSPSIPTGCLRDADCNDPSLVCCASASYSCVAAARCPAAAAACTTPATTIAGGVINAPIPPPNSCTRPLAKVSGLPTAQVQPFGTQTVGKTVSFTVPPGTGSVTIVQQAVTALDAVVFRGQVIENSAIPLSVVTPDGTKIYDDNKCCDADGGDPSIQFPVYFGGGGAGTLALTIPNATTMLSAVYRDGGGLPSGTWTMTVNDFSKECVGDPNCTDGGSPSSTYDVSVLTKPGLPESGQLDVNLYLVAASPGFDNTTAAANKSVQRFVQSLASIYAQVGICLRTVKVYDVPQWAKDQYGTSVNADKTDPCSALDQMLTLSQPGNNALNFFLVQSILAPSLGAGKTVVGVDGTIPGPSTIGGTIHSGAAVSLADLGSVGCTGPFSLSCGPDNVAYIAAHEGGHFMGLFHTSESSGEFFDPLTDTPTCRCETCVGPSQVGNCKKDGTGVTIEPRTCNRSGETCGGGDNLMFWIFDQQSQGNLSPQQGQVMRLNPVVQ